MKYLYFWALVLLILISCSEPTVPPPPPDTGPDTSSHNFTWTIDTLGEYGSFLKDVSIIDKNNIWLVGEIKFQGNIYNAVHWNGTAWELKTILYNYQGSNFYSQILSVFTFEKNNLWIGMNQPMHWDGSNWSTFDLSTNAWDGWINKVWGTSSANLYLVGDNGNITHYNGSSWQRLESGTDINLLDVWGSPDGSVVWVCGYTEVKSTVLLKITNLTVEKVYEDSEYRFTMRNDSLSGDLTSVWTSSSDSIYIASPFGMYSASSTTKGEAKRSWVQGDFQPKLPRRIRGFSINDIFMVGAFNSVAHFNGSSWCQYHELTGRAYWYSLDVMEDIVCLAGIDPESGKALIAKGIRLK